MKETEEMLITTVCAAMASLPIQPMIRLEARNMVLSKA